MGSREDLANITSQIKMTSSPVTKSMMQHKSQTNAMLLGESYNKSNLPFKQDIHTDIQSLGQHTDIYKNQMSQDKSQDKSGGEDLTASNNNLFQQRISPTNHSIQL